ncbi:hypothetical protein B0H14DRAFT_3505307 [Mycena olivaceomarginata]|nr:hypothetical protein B0H14DRAFT_3505307 [Mycena olivaceomarginata]
MFSAISCMQPHIYQGLDVVVFRLLKLYWSDEKKYEWKKHQPVTKENFLAIYSAAHVCALTVETIKTAFCKTGVWPFNREVIMEAMMAPSLETFVCSHLPIAPTRSASVSIAWGRSELSLHASLPSRKCMESVASKADDKLQHPLSAIPALLAALEGDPDTPTSALMALGSRYCCGVAMEAS